jgi:hypothetical protein
MLQFSLLSDNIMRECLFCNGLHSSVSNLNRAIEHRVARWHWALQARYSVSDYHVLHEVSPVCEMEEQVSGLRNSQFPVNSTRQFKSAFDRRGRTSLPHHHVGAFL